MVSDSTIFRAYDIRGVFGKSLSVETMLNIGRALGTYLTKKKHHKITIGGDIRNSTSILQNALIAGVCSTGISCDVVDQSPLGITLFHSFLNRYAASAFITASHLPPEWNGVKFYWGPGIGFSPKENDEVHKIYQDKEFVTCEAFDIGKTRPVYPYTEFVKYLKSKFNFGKKFKIAIDCGNGATSLVVPELYEDLGFEVISLFAEPDPRFPNRPSEPNEETLQQLSHLVKESNVDFAAGFDGDGDRCLIVDELGNILSADAFGLIVADYLIKTTNNNKIIINMECSLAMENHLKDIGAKVKRIRVGHSFLSMEADKIGAVFGVEASGHAIAPSIFLFDDALILPMLFALAVEKSGKKVSELASEIKLPIKKRYDLKCSDHTKFRVIEKVVEFFKLENGEINDLDGISLSNNLGRILVRVSNTSPKIRVTVESMKNDLFNQLGSLYLDKIRGIISAES